ncbi:response regulator [Paraburkholderia sp. BL9I2N2]|uniref:response regulator transcription factor n=1 Tax=Paraburkholderia sp. BL9I2N2 TaxID=1938809 RepID=UPI0010532DEA|nr:response regulator [Paraburkholderia sp. BL9I2N2]TCK84333.1 response regulator receiver domain-containing protein [Paraburkholderia sp. BL9I2N2]
MSQLRVPRIASIVDDDEAVRLATASLVRSLGWDTRVFASAEEFLASASVGETACLISDVIMSGMSGVDLHDRLLERGCAPPTILMTAFPTAVLQAKILAKIEANSVLAFLEKPVDAAALAQCLTLASGGS